MSIKAAATVQLMYATIDNKIVHRTRPHAPHTLPLTAKVAAQAKLSENLLKKFVRKLI